MLKTAAIGVLTVLTIALFVVGSLRAQMNQRDRDKPSTQPVWPTNSQWPQPQYPQYPQRPGQPQPNPASPQPQLPPQQGGGGGSTFNLIPSFLQAGRTYAFQPAVGDPFVARVISIDATGWVQVQRNAGSDVGPVADWYNLQNMVAMKAQQ